jgi:uncharacterized delta-60 repeat protein
MTGHRLLCVCVAAAALLAGEATAGRPDPGTHRSAAGRHRGVLATNAGRSTAAARLRHADRWAAKRDAGLLTPTLAQILGHQEERGTADALRGHMRPRRHLRGGKPGIMRPEGLPEGTNATVDSLLATWVTHYSSGLAPSTDAYTAVTTDAAGNIYACGYTTGIFTGDDYIAVKYNSGGALQWVATYSGPGNDYDAATAIGLDPSGNVFVTGSSFGVDGDEDFATVKYSPTGQQLWVARYDGPAHDYDAALALKVDAGGNVVVTGISTGITTDGDYTTIKYTSTGAQFWVRRYDGAYDLDIPAGVGIDLSGNVYVSGTSVGEESWEDYVTVKYSYAGDSLWAARYDGTGNDYDAVAAMTVDISGNSYVTGTSYNLSGDADVVTVKYTTFGQRDWLNRYDSPDHSDESAASLTIDASRNVYVAGTYFGFGTAEDYLTVKYSTNGGVRWVAVYNGTGNSYDAASSVAVDASGNVLVTGLSNGLISLEDMVTVKYSSLGTQSWVQRYVGPQIDYDAGLAITVDASSNVVSVGSSYGIVTDEDALLVKYATGGTQQWAMRYNGEGNSADEAVGAALDAAGNIYVCGTSYDLESQSDFAVVKYSPAGQELWVQRYNGTGEGEDFASAIAVDATGNVYVTGTSLSILSGYDVVTLKYNTGGGLVWSNHYTSLGSAIDEAADLAIDASGNVYVTGSRTDAATGVDMLTIKYSAGGAQSWVATYNNSAADSTDEAYDIAVDGSGNVFITGASYRDGTDFDCTTIKYNSAGAQQWVARYNGPGSALDRGYALAVDGSNVVVTGVTTGGSSGHDIVTLRYSSTGTQQWARNYSGAGAGEDTPTALTLGPGGDVFVGGTTFGTAGFDFVVLKYNNAGTQQWAALYDNAEHDDDVITTMTVDGAGNVYASGYSFLLASGYDFLTVKLNTAGVRQWTSRLDDPAQFNDEPRSIAVDASGNIYVTGYSETEDGSVFSVVKYEAPLVGLNRTTVAFPSAQVGCRLDDTVVVRNASGTNLLAVASVISSDQNFTVTPTSFSLAPHESLQVAIRFAPLTAGLKSGWLVLQHNGLSSPDSLRLTGSGTGTGTALLVNVMHQKGWRLYALPVAVSCPITVPYSYAFSNGYFRSDTLVNGRGYWTKLTDPEMHFTGFAIPADSVPLVQGWNLIGGITSAVRVGGIRSVPDSLIRTSYFGYAGGYAPADSIRPGRGYWVKSRDPGFIILQHGAMETVPAGRPVPPEAGRLTVTDAAGASQDLFWIAGDPDGALAEYYELPPPPPEGVFDVRFATGRMLEAVPPGSVAEIPVTVVGAVPPLTLHWSSGEAGGSLVVEGTAVPVAGGGSMTLDAAHPRISLRIGAAAEHPSAFALEQNFPNPFNPTTEIRFSVPSRSAVTLRVYDLLGREVGRVFDGVIDAGSRTVRWNGVAADGVPLAGGVYFYRLEAQDPASGKMISVTTRKMLLLK